MTDISKAPGIVDATSYGLIPGRISPQARQVIERLKDAGYTAYLVGGCVRDLILGQEPKDFDVVTQARPEEIRQVFRNARLIGRRFRLAHVHFGREIIEVATYRAAPSADSEDDNGNVFGTLEEDAFRRDFTVNALYYDPDEGLITDYVNGLHDLTHARLRVIGDPEARFREDPVRMLRAVRFAAKLRLQLTEDGRRLLPALGPLLQGVAPARLFEEVLKLFHTGNAAATYETLCEHRLFEVLFPGVAAILGPHADRDSLLGRALANSDQRLSEGKPVTPAFLFAALLWEGVREEAMHSIAEGAIPVEAWTRAAEHVLREQLRVIMIPKRFSVPMREIWGLQSRFERRAGRHAFRFLESKRFRAAYDFLGLRAASGEAPAALFDWWTRFQEVTADEREAMAGALSTQQGEKRPRKRRRRRAAGG
ncbi:polynucleotide adenylyltransferase PcnB [Acidiferrobacter sp. SPIII_3]|uniref:polynucleotide adenylyltransferase PcnB n=1 Tax=Acidiferrobacter sp. SPIII_3 TaxID=1281578 RepID=UPI000D735C95|nr:polynucleotide adenylyltransferase PcnB [Acidiferrobacter sp. SPIII_3]AWP23915.1 polynucleotide adenylyltransferase PcnB [Acidiferrobacter sp. SPIII_3]